MKLLRFFDRTLTAIVSVLLVLTLVTMLTLAATQVFLRGLFHSGILWGDVAARYLVMWVGFLGAYLATHEDRHLRIDILTRFLKPNTRLWFNAFTDLFAAAICYFLIRAGWTFVVLGMDADAILFLHVSQKTAAMIVPAGFALIMLQFLIRTIESITRALRKTGTEVTVS
jgi:TRAP-type C4-dicarboxylate transport system permease small subunit